MRIATLPAFCALLIGAATANAQTAEPGSEGPAPAANGAPAPPAPEDVPPNPIEVALVQSDEGMIYQRSSTSDRLYISDADPVGRSNCQAGCRSAWPPVLASGAEKPIGDWTAIRQRDGTWQWAIRGKPVYSRFHNERPDPAQEPGWHLLTLDRANALPRPPR